MWGDKFQADPSIEDGMSFNRMVIHQSMDDAKHSIGVAKHCSLCLDDPVPAVEYLA